MLEAAEVRPSVSPGVAGQREDHVLHRQLLVVHLVGLLLGTGHEGVHGLLVLLLQTTVSSVGGGALRSARRLASMHALTAHSVRACTLAHTLGHSRIHDWIPCCIPLTVRGSVVLK